MGKSMSSLSRQIERWSQPAIIGDDGEAAIRSSTKAHVIKDEAIEGESEDTLQQPFLDGGR